MTYQEKPCEIQIRAHVIPVRTSAESAMGFGLCGALELNNPTLWGGWRNAPVSKGHLKWQNMRYDRTEWEVISDESMRNSSRWDHNKKIHWSIVYDMIWYDMIYV